jgi:methylmalonyl-CoA/ethylmalonyl-CoA epimerase
VRITFAQVGDQVFIEFVEPLGADSPVTKFIERGGGLYHVCYLVPDIEAAIERVRGAGGLVVTRPTPARAFDGRCVAFVYTRDHSLIEFLQELNQEG